MSSACKALPSVNDYPARGDSTLERALKRQIAAHNLEAVVFLYDLTEAQVSAVVRGHVSHEITVRQVVARVYEGLSDEITTYDDTHFTLLGWLIHRAKTLARDHGRSAQANPRRGCP